MARYFFDVKNGHRLIDPSGVDCRDDREAIRTGRMIARQIAADALPKQPRHVEVLNDDRQQVGQVPVSSNGKPDQDADWHAVPQDTQGRQSSATSIRNAR